jgi:dienelactone hydrolase
MFAGNGVFSHPIISPDGSRIAMHVPIGNQYGVAVIETATGKRISRINLGSEGSVGQYFWASPSRLAVGLEIDYGFSEHAWDTGEVIGVDAEGKSSNYLLGYRGTGPSDNSYVITRDLGRNLHGRLIGSLPNDPGYVLVAAQTLKEFGTSGTLQVPDTEIPTVVYRLDVNNGVRDHAVTAPINGEVEFAADDKGFVRYVVGHDEKGVAQSYVRSPEKPDWTLLSVAKVDHDADHPLSLARDNSAVFLSSDGDSPRRCLVRQDLKTGQRTSLSCDDVADLDGIVMSFDGNEPVAAVYESGQPILRLLDTKNPARKALEDLAKAFPGQTAIPVSATGDGRLSVVEVRSDRNPGDFYLFDTKSLSAKYITSSNQGVDPDQMAESRPISFAARDGVMLHGYLTLPAGQAPKKLPLVVNPHGGPFDERDYWEWNADVQALASRGYAVLRVNFRGSGGYGSGFEAAGRRGWDKVMIDDITDGAHWAAAQGYADPARMCVYGASYGGYAALMSGVREPDLYKCVVDVSGISDLVAYSSDSDVAQDIGGAKSIADFIGPDTKSLHDASPLTYIDRLKAAIFIVHGKNDVRVPYSQATKLRAALDARHYPYDWLVKSGEGHGFADPKDQLEFYTKLMDFLDRNIGTMAVTAK